MDAEKQKTDSGLEHQIMTLRFHQAESKVQQIEQKFKSSIQKSRPYFEEKQICNDQLQTQKERIQQLQAMLQSAKANYSRSLKSLEMISESIHKKRGDLHIAPPPGVRLVFASIYLLAFILIFQIFLELPELELKSNQ